jgi:hypothetical protein
LGVLFQPVRFNLFGGQVWVGVGGVGLRQLFLGGLLRLFRFPCAFGVPLGFGLFNASLVFGPFL